MSTEAASLGCIRQPRPGRTRRNNPALPPAFIGDALIPEEMELLLLMCRGYSAMDVVKILGAKKHRIYYIRDRIMLKADVASEVELGVWAAKRGIL